MRSLNRGFSLIEVAIVLAVIGVLISSGLLAVSPIAESNHETASRARMKEVENALQVYVIQNGCLPCPADGSLTNGNAGRAVANGGGFYVAGCPAAGCAATRGVVPYRALGIAEHSAADDYETLLSYAVSTDLAMPTSIQRVGSDYDPGPDFAPLSVSYEVPDPACLGPAACPPIIQTGTTAAYVLISHGRDGAGGNAIQSGILRAERYASPTQQENADGDAEFAQRSKTTADGTSYYDDLVTWQTLPIIIQGCGAGSCGNPS